MTRATTALLAALDAVLAVAIGVGVPLLMLTVLWAVQFDLSLDWSLFWRAAADFWLLGNGVDLLVVLDPQSVAQLGLTGAATPFEIGFAPLGFALLTVLLGRRSGLRLGQSPFPVLGVVVGVVTVSVLSGLVWLSATSSLAAPSGRQAFIWVAGLYGLGAVVGAAGPQLQARTRIAAWCARQLHRLPEPELPLIATALRGGAMIAAAMIGLGALLVSISLVVHYSTVISLYESVQSGVAGGAALTLAQIAMLPNLAVWAASWMLGPGFVVGAGSSVGPLGTQLGLIPSLPILGALPQGAPLGFLTLIAPVAIGFIAAVILRPRLFGPSGELSSRDFGVGRLVGTGVGMGVVAASILSLLAVASGGALGPGRLADVGADPGWVWVWAAVLFSVACTVGLLAGGLRRGGAPTRDRGSDRDSASDSNRDRDRDRDRGSSRDRDSAKRAADASTAGPDAGATSRTATEPAAQTGAPTPL